MVVTTANGTSPPRWQRTPELVYCHNLIVGMIPTFNSMPIPCDLHKGATQKCRLTHGRTVSTVSFSDQHKPNSSIPQIWRELPACSARTKPIKFMTKLYNGTICAFTVLSIPYLDKFLLASGINLAHFHASRKLCSLWRENFATPSLITPTHPEPEVAVRTLLFTSCMDSACTASDLEAFWSLNPQASMTPLQSLNDVLQPISGWSPQGVHHLQQHPTATKLHQSNTPERNAAFPNTRPLTSFVLPLSYSQLPSHPAHITKCRVCTKKDNKICE